METQPRRFKLSTPALEWIVVATVIATAIAFAAFGVWIFRAGPDADPRSIPRIILSDRATLGFVRLLAATGALYGLASIAVLVMRGRWVRSVSTTGISADAASYSDESISELKAKLRRAQDERDEANRLLWGVLHG